MWGRGGGVAVQKENQGAVAGGSALHKAGAGCVQLASPEAAVVGGGKRMVVRSVDVRGGRQMRSSGEIRCRQSIGKEWWQKDAGSVARSLLCKRSILCMYVQ